MGKVLVVIPAYNEQNNLIDVVNNLEKDAPFAEYIIVNDCSTDETIKLCRENNLNYLDLPCNLGIGGAVQTGYKYAVDNGFDIIIQHDGDGQHDPKSLADVCKSIQDGKSDIVIGSRYVDKAYKGFQSTKSRRAGINILSKVIKLRCGVDIKDVTSGYRAVNSKYAKFYSTNYPVDYPEPEAICTAALAGARISEVPVIMKERTSGESSINFRKSVYYMIKVTLGILFAKRIKSD